MAGNAQSAKRCSSVPACKSKAIQNVPIKYAKQFNLLHSNLLAKW